MKIAKWTQLIPACVSGNILELYDFVLYAYFAPIIGEQFFPSENQTVTTMLSFSVFATGCAMRPVGAVFFGWFGDKFGRKKALVYSVSAMIFSTCLIGLLPNFASVGIAAPIMLLISRLIQGLSMCGEEVGAAIYLMESAPKNRSGIAGSTILGGVFVGLMLASLVSLATISSMTQEMVVSWGWRIPFLLSLPFGVIAVIIRVKQVESPLFQKITNQHRLSDNSVLYVFKNNKLIIVQLIGVACLMSVAVYLYVIYFPSYISHNFPVTLSQTMLIISVCFLITAITSILSGMLCDKVGYTVLMRAACIGFIILAIPLSILINIHTIVAILIVELCMAVLMGVTAGSLMPHLAAYFPTQIRFSGMAIPFNVSMTVFGSTAPVITLYLTKMLHLKNAFIAYLVIAAFITLASSIVVAKNKQEKYYA